MRRIIIAATTVVSLAIAIGLSTAAATTKPVHFTVRYLGASISAKENVLDIRATPVTPPGASIQIVHTNASGTRGTSTETTYYGNGIVISKDTYTLSKPDAKGRIAIKGTGKFVRGTGIYKHVTGGYKIAGTFDTKTGRSGGVLTGTISR